MFVLFSRMYISDPKQGPLMVMWHWVDETMGVLNYSVAPVTKMIPKYKPEIATAVRLTRPLNSKVGGCVCTILGGAVIEVFIIFMIIASLENEKGF